MYLEVKDLKKSYGKDSSYIQVLKGVSTGVEKGQICVIQGSSGGGKSTLLRCINLFETPSAGEIILNGENIVDTKKPSEYRQKSH